MKNKVSTYRSAGLEAKWGKSRNGAPFIFLRNPNATALHQRNTWWICDRSMFEAMERDGIIEGFTNCTLLGDIFGVPA